MLKRMIFCLTAVILLAAMSMMPILAQTAPMPDKGVRGSGSILVRETTTGTFDINVGQSGSVLIGGFRYAELSPDSATRQCVIYSQTLTALEIVGNRATIKALGYWNGMQANIVVEVLDDNPSGDWFHISAVPTGPMTILYDAAGGIKGDIVVFSKPPSPDLYTKGEGAIAVGRNQGRFRFAAQSVSGIVKGTLTYAEVNPMIMSSVIRPSVRIYVPEVQRLAVTGNIAVFSGKGTLNGRPALVEARIVDNSRLAVAKPDEFYIRARPLATDSVSSFAYDVGGLLIVGDVVVVTAIP